MTTFIETPRFPEDISYNSRGGPEWMTELAISRSGSEQANMLWSYPRHRYDAMYGINTQAKLETVLRLFHATGGRAIGFRYKDWLDFKSCALGATPAATDCQIGVGDGTQDDFQLVKLYTWGAVTRVRKILKPVAATVKVAVNGTEKTITTHFTVDTTTGVVTVTAGFQFDVPCRFDTDHLSVNLDDYASASAQVPLVERKYGSS